MLRSLPMCIHVFYIGSPRPAIKISFLEIQFSSLIDDRMIHDLKYLQI